MTAHREKAPRDALVEATADRLIGGGATVATAIAVPATLSRWATDHGVSDAAILDLAERLAPPKPKENP